MIGPMIGASRLVRAYRSGRSMYARACPARKKTAYSSSRTTMLSLNRMFRGARHIRLLPFATSSHPIVAISDHLGPRDHVHAALERRLHVREELADALDRLDGLLPVLGRLRLEQRRVLPERDDRVEERRVPLVQLVQLRLEHLDVRDESGVALFRVADLALEALDLHHHDAHRLERLHEVVRGERRPRAVEGPSGLLQLVRDLDPQEVVRGPQVLAPPVACEAGDHELDSLQQATVFLDALADVDHSVTFGV